jgi:hypothetical protein
VFDAVVVFVKVFVSVGVGCFEGVFEMESVVDEDRDSESEIDEVSL